MVFLLPKYSLALGELLGKVLSCGGERGREEAWVSMEKHGKNSPWSWVFIAPQSPSGGGQSTDGRALSQINTLLHISDIVLYILLLPISDSSSR